MSLRRTLPVTVASAVILLSQADASQFRPLPPDNASSETAVIAPPATVRTGSDRPLPYARGRRFANLDEYLAFRRKLGAIDLPWYEEVEPGIYVLRTTMRPAAPVRRFTRAELARQFRFDR